MEALREFALLACQHSKFGVAPADDGDRPTVQQPSATRVTPKHRDTGIPQAREEPGTILGIEKNVSGMNFDGSAVMFDEIVVK